MSRSPLEFGRRWDLLRRDSYHFRNRHVQGPEIGGEGSFEKEGEL